jgi:hypothetical protein
MTTSQSTVVEHWMGTCGYCGNGAPLRLIDGGIRRTVADMVRGAWEPQHQYRVECRACGNGPRITVPASVDAVPAGLIPSQRVKQSAQAG